MNALRPSRLNRQAFLKERQIAADCLCIVAERGLLDDDQTMSGFKEIMRAQTETELDAAADRWLRPLLAKEIDL
jgi:hypothetical protein